MSLFGAKPAWRNKNPSVRRPAVAELRDPAALIQVLCVEEDADIARIAAARIVDLGRVDLLVETLNARRMTTIPAIDATRECLEVFQRQQQAEEQRRRSQSSDPATLLRVVLECGDVKVALEALSRIQDQRVLAEALRRSSYERVMDAARAKINDPLVLREMVEDSRFHGVHERVLALQRLGDPAYHASVAMNARLPHELQLAALKLLREPAALRQVALASENASLRYEAIDLVDDDVRAEMAMTDPDSKRRSAAADRIRDAAVLERLALTASDGGVRRVASRRQQEGDRLERLARSADADVREVAISKLRDPGLLRRLLESEKHQRVRGAIEARLRHDDVLTELARSGSADEQSRAISRLRDRAELDAIARSGSEFAPQARERVARIEAIAAQVDELNRRIENLKQLPDYRQDLEWKISGDSQTFAAYMLTPAGRSSPLVQVDNLEAEIVALRKSLDE
jgi:hypothetical protein